MSRSTTTRQLVRTVFQNTSHHLSASRPRCATALQFAQPFSSSTPRRDDDDVSLRQNVLAGIVKPRARTPAPLTSARPSGPPAPRPKRGDNLNVLAHSLLTAPGGRNEYNLGQMVLKPAIDSRNANLSTILDEGASQDEQVLKEKLIGPDPEPYHFHVFSHKHNTHVTVTKPSREPIVSLSCGNLGFRKSHRKTYDAAYQLGAYVVDKLQQQGWHNKIDSLEVCLRGFGQGREAVTKVLMGTEGSLLRTKVTKVSDSTRLKFGGTRSKRPRRL